MKGKKYGRLLGIKQVGVDSGRNATWLFQCDCGKQKIIKGDSVRLGNTQSCGCLWLENHLKRFKTHGDSATRLYKLWQKMKARCFGKKTKEYKHYGERGITVCNEWLKYPAFKEWALRSGYTDKLSIERIDVNKNYCPDNCTWILRNEQNRNKRNSLKITLDGKEQLLLDVAKQYGIKYFTLYARIHKYGFSPEEAVKMSVIKKVKTPCAKCGILIETYPCRVRKYCSHRCYTDSKKKK